MSYRGDVFGTVGAGALSKGIGAVAGLAGTAIGGPLGGLLAAGLGSILGSTFSGLFGEDENSASMRRFQEAAIRDFNVRRAWFAKASPAQKRRVRRQYRTRIGLMARKRESIF